MKLRRPDLLAVNYMTMLDLLTGALAALIIIFVVSPKESSSKTKNITKVIKNNISPHVGQKFILEKVYFLGNSSKLYPNSITFIKNNLVPYLKENNNLNFIIEGHTNTIAKNKEQRLYAVKLSKKRARSVYQLLLKEGLSSRKMKYIGFGGTRLLSKKVYDKEKGLLNRRVEIRFY